MSYQENWINAGSNFGERVLDYYEHMFFRSPHVIYAALVQKTLGHQAFFQLEIGVNSNSIKIEDWDPKSTLNLDFPENIIPRHLLMLDPMSFGPFYYDTESTPFSIQNIDDTVIKNTNSLLTSIVYLTGDPVPTIHKEIKEIDWINQPIGSQYICDKRRKLTGTLGSFFYLEEAPDTLFGISNWHVCGARKSKIGDPVFMGKPKDKLGELGKLYWFEIDTNKEVAFIKINDNLHRDLITMYCDDFPILKLGSPEVGQLVYHRGAGSRNGNTEFMKSSIHSINATIKIYSTRYGNSFRIFKNQILVNTPFSEDGDSGAILFSKPEINSQAVGLIFASPYVFKIAGKNVSTKFTVANHLSNIFNSNEKSVVYNQHLNNIIHTNLLTNRKLK